MNYWILKTDADTYSFDDLIADGETIWDGVRNYQARNNLRAMIPGDIALIYHSVTDKCIVGTSEIISSPMPDPTDETNQWTAVRIKPLDKLSKYISLDEIKSDPKLAELGLVRQSRLSVIPISSTEFEIIISKSQE